MNFGRKPLNDAQIATGNDPYHRADACGVACSICRYAQRHTGSAPRPGIGVSPGAARLVAVLLCVSLLSGCTMTIYKTQPPRLYRVSVLLGVVIDRGGNGLCILPDGTAILDGYDNDGGGKQAGAAIGAAAKGAL